MLGVLLAAFVTCPLQTPVAWRHNDHLAWCTSQEAALSMRDGAPLLSKNIVNPDGTHPFPNSLIKCGTCGQLLGNSAAALRMRVDALDTPDWSCRAVDKSGRLVRSDVRKRRFMKLTGYPKGRKGYVVDHIVALACGGCDVPSNMQWQTVAEAKAKDRWELDCAKVREGAIR